jgi:hypothetical protein
MPEKLRHALLPYEIAPPQYLDRLEGELRRGARKPTNSLRQATLGASAWVRAVISSSPTATITECCDCADTHSRSRDQQADGQFLACAPAAILLDSEFSL